MIHPDDKQERRRSQRIPESVPLFVREVDTPFMYGGNVKTIEVSRHGCVIHALRPFPRGTELRLELLYGNRTTTARVVHSDPIGTGMHLTTWTVALALDQPGNVWMVESLSPDWPKTSEQQRSRGYPAQIPHRDTEQENRTASLKSQTGL